MSFLELDHRSGAWLQSILGSWRWTVQVAVVAVVLALAVVSEAGVLPWGWPYAGLPAAYPVAAWPPAAIHAAYPAYAHHGAYLAAPHAAILAAPHAPAASVAHHAGVVPGATSVTATRGAAYLAVASGSTDLPYSPYDGYATEVVTGQVEPYPTKPPPYGR
uniref:Uncharacterized protein n=1 Tax=Anopheles melas TaxID=34690 RepID=A0A182ULA3_9DIPT